MWLGEGGGINHRLVYQSTKLLFNLNLLQTLKLRKQHLLSNISNLHLFSSLHSDYEKHGFAEMNFKRCFSTHHSENWKEQTCYMTADN